MGIENFSDWFRKLCEHPAPRDWQIELTSQESPRSQFIRIPTGLGKTEGVLSAWSYHRLAQYNPSWPRRLVWCLPMRVLVEQTYQIAREIAERINRELKLKDVVSVHQAMGGEEMGDWFLFPERPAIIVGTQDMLLSRALNRGYGSSRARWPIEYGLLNHDSLWVMDEVQLMDVGLATSAQLQAYREQDAAQIAKPCFTWWMSATLQQDWLASVDTKSSLLRWAESPCVVPDSQRTGELFDIKKALMVESIEAKNTKHFAELIDREHKSLSIGEHGRITLVVCNTVKRACDTYDQLRSMNETQNIELVHSRFRPAERERWRTRFLSKQSCGPEANRIIIATQVVEAGVDISAGCLISELAPWPSLVQRFGRCARYGGNGKVIVVDRGHDEKNSSPYTEEELTAAFGSLQRLVDVGIASLESHEKALTISERKQLFPFSPEHLLLRTEYDELFDTTPDLTGADIDISRFIRTGDERDLQVFWVDVDSDAVPSSLRQAQRKELCSVKFTEAQNWLCGEETKSARKPTLTPRMQNRAWIWDWIDGRWVTVRRADLLPGRIVCVASDRGGYTEHRGFDPTSNTKVVEVNQETVEAAVKEANAADSQQDNEQLSFNGWKTIPYHSEEVKKALLEISDTLQLDREVKDVLSLVATWHDIGKAHPAFQSMLRGNTAEGLEYADLLLAKSGSKSKGRPRYFSDDTRLDERRGFRHELASALALFAVLQIYEPNHPALLGVWRDLFQSTSSESDNVDSSYGQQNSKDLAHPKVVRGLLNCSAEQFDLLLYLVASHHGKVRLALHASPIDQEYQNRLNDGRGLPIRGVREGDRLPSLKLDSEDELLAELTLSLEPAAMGLSKKTGRSWRERTNDVLSRLGPTQLAYLEAIVRAADVRASQWTSTDPNLSLESSM